MSMLSEEMGRLNKRLQDAIEVELSAQHDAAEADKLLKAAQQRVKHGQKAIAQILNELSERQVSVRALEKSLIGVTVNRLRKHGTDAIAGKSEQLVRRWKTVVESGLQNTSPGARVQPSPGSAAASLRTGAPPQRRGGVLDAVRDDRGRVERRLADPDSHEDQLALNEVEMAERMWEEKMGGGGSSRSPSSALHGGGGRSAARASTTGLGASPPASKLPTAIANLRERYRGLEEKKKQHELIKLDKLPPDCAKRRRLAVPSEPRVRK